MNTPVSPPEIPGYDVLDVVGIGGMSTVWRARQLSLDRMVAIKILSPEYQLDAASLERFRVESQAAARLRHPSIVQVYDAGEVAGMPYLVMEFVDGCTVGDLLQRSGKLTERNALAIASAVAAALAYAWDKDCLIHLDVKPDNVMLESDGSIKVMDLGLARFIGLHQRRREDDTILGTPNYVSPEQAAGVTDLDCRTDIYSLGAMLYHLVTGRLPFREFSGSRAMDAHSLDYLPDPLMENPNLTPATAWFIEKLMVRDRAYRYLFWKGVLDDLAEVAVGRMPHGPLPEPGRSTVQRCSARAAPPPKPVVPATAPRPPVRVAASEAGPKKRVVLTAAAREAAAAAARPPAERGVMHALGELLIVTLCAAALGLFFFWRQAEQIMPKPVAAAAEPEEVFTPVLHTAEKLGVAPDLPVQPAAAPAPAPEPEARPDVQTAAIQEVEEPEPDAEVAERVGQDGNGVVVAWDNEMFREAAKKYNRAYELYTSYQKTRANPQDLKQAEQLARQAVRQMESLRGRAPADIGLDAHIRDAYHLIADVRHSTLLPASERASRPGAKTSGKNGPDLDL